MIFASFNEKILTHKQVNTGTKRRHEGVDEFAVLLDSAKPGQCQVGDAKGIPLLFLCQKENLPPQRNSENTKML